MIWENPWIQASCYVRRLISLPFNTSGGNRSLDLKAQGSYLKVNLKFAPLEVCKTLLYCLWFSLFFLSALLSHWLSEKNNIYFPPIWRHTVMYLDMIFKEKHTFLPFWAKNLLKMRFLSLNEIFLKLEKSGVNKNQ